MPNFDILGFAERLSDILRYERLNKSKFAKAMGMSAQVAGGYTNGKTGPNADFIANFSRVFPSYSFDWLLVGKGPMKRQGGDSQISQDIRGENNTTLTGIGSDQTSTGGNDNASALLELTRELLEKEREINKDRQKQRYMQTDTESDKYCTREGLRQNTDIQRQIEGQRQSEADRQTDINRHRERKS